MTQKKYLKHFPMEGGHMIYDLASKGEWGFQDSFQAKSQS